MNTQQLKELAKLADSEVTWILLPKDLADEGWCKEVVSYISVVSPSTITALVDRIEAAERERDEYKHRCKVSDGACAIAEQQRDHWMQRAKVAEAEIARRDAAAGDAADRIVDDGCGQQIGGVGVSDRLNCVWPIGTKFYTAVLQPKYADELKDRAELIEAYSKTQCEIAQDLGCDSDNESILKAIYELKALGSQPPAVLPELEQDVKNIIGLLAENEWAEHCTKSELGRDLECEITRLHDLRTQPQKPVVPDYFSSLVNRATDAAKKAMVKFPQPNYVLLKVAEEAGEVVQAGVHYAEGRETWDNLEGEVVQTIAMLYRLVTEGDQVNGITPPKIDAANVPYEVKK